ncbi:MAG TPA: hypothetical protein VKV40_20115 [Ktedonobacteraceae bacterium]|nr:hypothetical protein [Ktedonobacteraceae bacterium]
MPNDKRRSDAGNLQVTDRDILVLTWNGEQYACTFAHLQRLLAEHSPEEGKDLLSISATRNAVQRWLYLGLIEEPRKFRAGQTKYIWLSRRGLSEIGLPYPYYVPKLKSLAHIHAVNEVRLAIQGSNVWIPKRTLRIAAAREGGEDIAGLPDAEFYERSRTPVAIVVVEKPESEKDLVTLIDKVLKRYDSLRCYIHRDNVEVMRSIRAAFDHPADLQLYDLENMRDVTEEADSLRGDEACPAPGQNSASIIAAQPESHTRRKKQS